MSAQQSLLELFEAEKAAGAASFARVRFSEGPNPFRTQTGVCKSCSPNQEQRVYWCHFCGGKYCWDCHVKHKD